MVVVPAGHRIGLVEGPAVGLLSFLMLEVRLRMLHPVRWGLGFGADRMGQTERRAHHLRRRRTVRLRLSFGW